MKNTFKKVLVGLFLIAQSISSYSQTLSSEVLDKVDSIFTSHYNAKSPGGAFAIINKGEVVFKKTLGLANIEHQVPISDTTVFNIASNSKQLTTLLALILEEEGKLSFQDDIRIHLPELGSLPFNITIKQLTNHTHGLPNVDELAQLKGIDRITHDEVLNMLFNIKQFNFIPGDDYQYNNTGYVLLSEIIVRAGKKAFNEQLKEKIFDEFGMSDSQAVGDYNQVTYNKAYSYSSINRGFKNNPVKISTMGASGVYTSLDDLIKWAQNFTKTDNTYHNYFEKMQKPTVLSSGKMVEYGMGLQFESYKGIDIVFHGGGTESYRSYVLHAPKYGLSLVFLSNAGGFSGLDVIYTSLETILNDALEVDSKRIFETNHLPTYEGTYELHPGAYYSILTEKDSLFFQAYGTNEKMYLPRIGENTFDFPGLPYSKLIFYKNEFHLRFADFNYPAKRVTPPIEKELDIDLSEYVGSYKNTEHNSTYELVLIDNQLVVKHHAHGNIKLDIYSATSFYAINSFFGKIDFLFDKQSKVKGFNLSRQNITNLLFVK